MISVEQARARILSGLRPLPSETIPLSEAWRRVLAAPVVARLTHPPSDMSAMDGYALRAADASPGAVLNVIGEAPAGHPFAGQVQPGQAVRLFTGSVVPQGADAVLLQENATRDGNAVRINEAIAAGRHIRPRGQDFTEGDTVLHPGTRLTPRQIGLAAAANHAWLHVHRQPRVAILATGDEIALPGEALPAGGIVSSNSHMLAAMVRAAGGIPTILPVAPDRPDALADALAGGLGADLLVTTGGASVGDHDSVQAALAAHGFTLDFWQVAMRPGKPVISGYAGATPVLGLPGNPVSAAVTATLFMLPALAHLQGLANTNPPTATAIAGAPLRANDHRADFLRATLSRNDAGRLTATPFSRQDSAMLTVLSAADCLLLRAPYAEAADVGAEVQIIMLDQKEV